MTPLASSTGKRNQGVAVCTRARRQCSRVLPESVGMADRANGDKQAYASEA